MTGEATSFIILALNEVPKYEDLEQMTCNKTSIIASSFNRNVF
jgi:hypothetical protein